jgi:hypothetical protein
MLSAKQQQYMCAIINTVFLAQVCFSIPYRHNQKKKAWSFFSGGLSKPFRNGQRITGCKVMELISIHPVCQD